MTATTDRKLVTDVFTKILAEVERIYLACHWRITDAKMDLSMGYAMLRVEGPDCRNGTAVRIYTKPHPWDCPAEKIEVVVDWENQRNKGVFSRDKSRTLSGVDLLKMAREQVAAANALR